MTSLSAGSVCDVTAALQRDVTIFRSTSANESIVEFTSDTHATDTNSDGAFTSSGSGNGGLSRDYATPPITMDEDRDVSATWQKTMTTTSVTSRHTNKSLLITGSHQVTAGDAGGLSSKRNLSSPVVTLGGVSDSGSTWSLVTPHETYANIRLTETRDHTDARFPLALRLSADNASMSAAVGSNTVDGRSGSGLLREEVATVGAAVAGVAVFWSLLAVTMCAVVRVRKRKQRRRLRGSDVDAQTAMMEAMVRAELARGRSRVSDSGVPTYVNVAELIPRSSSSCDVDMSDFFHFVLDSNQPDSHGVWKKQRYSDVISGRPRDRPARWQDGSRTLQTREATCLSATCRQATSGNDHYCLLNDARDAMYSGNGQLPCNGLLTKVKSLDSVCKAPDEPAVETKHRHRPRRKRRYGVRRSASTSRCLVPSNNKLASSVNAPPVNG